MPDVYAYFLRDTGLSCRACVDMLSKARSSQVNFTAANGFFGPGG